MEKYTVQKGDSLWKISRRFGIDINELTNINGLRTKAEQHIIQPGQILNLPSKDKVYDTQLALIICDLAWRPLTNVKVRITFDGKAYDYLTDGNGIVAGLLIEDSTKGIKVELQHLNEKEYILIANHKKLPLGRLSLRISSREMIIKGSTSVKQGTQQSSKKQEKEKAKQKGNPSASSSSKDKTMESPTPSLNQTTRIEGGVPISVNNIGNVSEGLRLPPEAEQYRDYIIEAAKKYDFQPEGLAALIYAESRWKANATNNTGSGAVGLGQFKPDTWLSLCAKPESRVYQFITGKYSYQKLIYRNKKLWGETVDGTIAEIDTDTVLSLRLNAEYNIDMIGLLDRKSIEELINKWNLLSIKALEPDEMVKVAYLVHMNGTLGSVDIIMNGDEVAENNYDKNHIPTESTYEKRLFSNLKDTIKIERYHSIDGTYRTAFVAWMIDYYDSLIVPDHYRVVPEEKNYSIKDIIHKLNPKYIPKNDLPSEGVPSLQTQAQTRAPVTSQWHNPIESCQIRTAGMISARSASFGQDVRRDAAGNPRPHQGVDIKAEPGTPIYAVADGHIQFIIRNPSDTAPYGKTLCIVVDINDLPEDKKELCKYEDQPLERVYFFYAHLSEISPHLSRNAKVECGDILGKTGHTGNANRMTTIARGAHLHFEVRTRWDTGLGCDFHLDPSPFIDGFDYP